METAAAGLANMSISFKLHKPARLGVVYCCCLLYPSVVPPCTVVVRFMMPNGRLSPYRPSRFANFHTHKRWENDKEQNPRHLRRETNKSISRVLNTFAHSSQPCASSPDTARVTRVRKGVRVHEETVRSGYDIEY